MKLIVLVAFIAAAAMASTCHPQVQSTTTTGSRVVIRFSRISLFDSQSFSFLPYP